jgi:3-hydroxyisobutyrate dehydrogenase/2-hydroxy-3-oxopropionate reductase
MVMNAARLVGLTLPAAESASKVYQAGVDAGLGEEDICAIIKVVRK